jgi:hypothetical protein
MASGRANRAIIPRGPREENRDFATDAEGAVLGTAGLCD